MYGITFGTGSAVQRFQNILVMAQNVGWTDSVTVPARDLACANGAGLTVIDVRKAPRREIRRLLGALSGRRTAQVAEQVEAVRLGSLERLAQPLRAEGIAVLTRVARGSVFPQIIRHVLRCGNDPVLKGAVHGPERRPLRAQDLHLLRNLLRKCPVSLWICKDPLAERTRRIAAAIDPDPDDRTRDGLAHVVPELTTSPARREGARRDVLHAWSVAEAAVLRCGFSEPAEPEIEEIVAHERVTTAQRLDRPVADFDEFRDTTRVVHIKGIAADVVPEHVESEGIDTVVMGTVGRTGVAGFYIGNAAETILTRVECSVLARKPRGFVSPVAIEDEGDQT